MLEEKEALPSSEGHPCVDDGNDLASAGQGHADVGGHVIRSLVGVDKVGGVFWNEVIEEGLEVSPGTGVGIFHDDQARAGVLDKDGDGAGGDAGFGDAGFDLAGDLVGAFS